MGCRRAAVLIDAEWDDGVRILIADQHQSARGSISNPRGIEPWVDVQLMTLSLPVVWSMRKAAMVLCPRFEAYTHLPLRWTMISAVELVPVKSAG